MVRRFSTRRLELILLGAIVLLAAWLRFQHIDQAEFLWDQSEISKWALDAGQKGEFRFIGPMSSTGLTCTRRPLLMCSPKATMSSRTR